MNQALRVAVVSLAFVGICLSGAVIGWVATLHVENARIAREDLKTADFEKKLEDQATAVNSQLQQARQALQQARQQNQRLNIQLQQLRAAPKALPSPEQFGPQLMQRFVNQIRPTADQREKIRPMVNDAAESLRRLRRDTTHSTELILQNLEDQISVVLAPAQRDRFNDMIERNREALQQYNQDLQQRQAQQRLLEQQQRQQRQQGGGPGVMIAGQVKNPGRYPLAPDAPLTLVDLVAKAGGLTEIAQGNNITITHTDPSGDKVVRRVDLQAILKGRGLVKPDDPTLVLQPGDLVFVREALSRNAAPGAMAPSEGD